MPNRGHSGTSARRTRLERPRAGLDSPPPPTGTVDPTLMAGAAGEPDPKLPHSPTLPPKTRLGRYYVVRHIKTGGMGAVYRAEDPETGQVVAIKTMVAEVSIKSEAYARFLREVQAACAVRHRNVIHVYGFDVHQGTPYVIMEYLRGEGLNDLVTRGPLPIEHAADVVAAVCSAMGAVHDHQILHRDLKPSNIFLADSDEGEQVKVLDFGVSKLRTARDLTASNAIIGSVHYISPEQVRGAEIDERSDQFSLGVTLYECLTGRRPYPGETLFEVSDAILHGNPRPPRELRPDIPEALEEVVLRAMNPLPGQRFASMRDLGAALLPYASSTRQRQLADLLSSPVPTRRRARVSEPMPAAWFNSRPGVRAPRGPVAPVSASETRPLPTAVLPNASRDAAAQRAGLAETRSLPGVAALIDDFNDLDLPLIDGGRRSGRKWIVGLSLMAACSGAAVFAVCGGTNGIWHPTARRTAERNNVIPGPSALMLPARDSPLRPPLAPRPVEAVHQGTPTPSPPVAPVAPVEPGVAAVPAEAPEHAVREHHHRNRLTSAHVSTTPSGGDATPTRHAAQPPTPAADPSPSSGDVLILE